MGKKREGGTLPSRSSGSDLNRGVGTLRVGGLNILSLETRNI